MANITLILMKNWVYLLVIVLAVGLVGVNHLRGLEADKSLLKDRIIADLEAKVDSSNKALSLKSESCNIDDALFVELDKDKQSIDLSAKSIDDQLLNLKDNVSKESKANPYKLTEVSTNVYTDRKQGIPVPDDGILSNELTSLLNKAYCNTEPEDSSCINSQ